MNALITLSTTYLFFLILTSQPCSGLSLRSPALGDVQFVHNYDEEEEELGAANHKFHYWTGSTVLNKKDGFKLYWKIENEDSLVIKMELATFSSKGWMGFGIGEFSSGSMLGADIVTVYLNKNGKPIVEDRYVPFSAFPMSPYPELDECQDWQVVSHSKSFGKWSVILSRKLITGDTQDREIKSKGLNRIVYAWQKDVDSIGYHGINRHGYALDFSIAMAPEVVVPKDAHETIDITLDNYNLPSQDGDATHYACQGFDLGSHDRRVVMIEPKVQAGHEHVVHHLLVHQCSDDFPYNLHKDGTPPKACLGLGHGISPLAFHGCKTLMYAWAIGGAPLVLPEDTGFRIGKTGTRYLVLEIHFNNPALTSNIVDNSGVVLHVTKDLRSRKHDATVFVLGDAQISLPDLDPKVISHREVTCLSSCTKNFKGDIHVFGSFIHMHSYGRSAFTMRYPNDNSNAGVVANQVNYWDFDYQQTTPVSYTISPGDRLNLHGLYDLTKTEQAVKFGEASTEEMLFDFLFVYPAANLNDIFVCGRQRPGMSICGNLTPFDAPDAVPNPIPDGLTEPVNPFGKPSETCKPKMFKSFTDWFWSEFL